MIVVTGARGFIGSNLVKQLNQNGHTQLILVDELTNPAKNVNLLVAKYLQLINRNEFIAWFEANAPQVKFVFHLGARTDTTEFNEQVFETLNINYSKAIWQVCVKHQIGLVYASSAATYGNGSLGYSDEQDIARLKPLNPYGESKQIFDLWTQKQAQTPPFFAGLKFFNVYGPNENHKGRMASVIWHAYQQIKKTGKMKLFRSHVAEFKNGEQKRDFIYVNDVVNICLWMQDNQPKSGLYNVGTGKARTFLSLVNSVFNALQITPNIEFIDIPADIRNTYQYYTQATTNKLLNAGYNAGFTSLEEGVSAYVNQLKLY